MSIDKAIEAVDETIAKIPENRILVETDCPYLTPPQKRGEAFMLSLMWRPELIFISETDKLNRLMIPKRVQTITGRMAL